MVLERMADEKKKKKRGAKEINTREVKNDRS